MIAWKVLSEPAILNLSRYQFAVYTNDDGRQEEIPVERARECFAQFHGLLSFLSDWQRGSMTVSMSEFRRLPALLLDYRRLFMGELTKARQEGT